ncbi:hypothetical protein APHAL10511_000461 [Amanita phalloides]|nr:hypothetical protein APHAL10511_000461 [Amanita phalloides]
MTAVRVIITGPSGVSTRLEINDFIKDEKFFTLFIKAIQRMQNTDETDDRSYFAVAGIHGQPYIAWNGATGSFAPGNWEFGGYCAHSSVLFPTWHRPYLLLLEQIIQEHAIEIATQFISDQAGWKKAALDLRFPYWDWVVNALPPDCVIKGETVSVVDFDGNLTTVDNPLIRYRFRQKHRVLFDDPFDKWSTTLRHPTPGGKDDTDKLIQTLANAQVKTADDTVALLAWVRDWDSFSNNTEHQESITNSLEGIHDQMHNHIGGTGHMGEISVAAFDPIFYLHHCNIDRLVSIWSGINGGKWVCAGENDGGGNFTLAPRAALNEDTGLAPFWSTGGTFWSSKQMFETEKIGYTYPASNDKPARETAEQYMDKFPGGFFVSSDVENGWYWSVRIRSKKFELGRSFSVLVFLGDVPEDPNQWASSRNLVGAHHVVTNSAIEYCHNCLANIGAINEGFVHLNRYLLSTRPFSGVLDPLNLSSFLSDQLQWRVMDNRRIPVQLCFLEVTMMSVPIMCRPGALLPMVDTKKPIFRHNLLSNREAVV